MFVLYKWAIFYGYVSILVGGFNHLEKYSSMGRMTSHILWKMKKGLKPPTSIDDSPWDFEVYVIRQSHIGAPRATAELLR